MKCETTNNETEHVILDLGVRCSSPTLGWVYLKNIRKLNICNDIYHSNLVSKYIEWIYPFKKCHWAESLLGQIYKYSPQNKCHNYYIKFYFDYTFSNSNILYNWIVPWEPPTYYSVSISLPLILSLNKNLLSNLPNYYPVFVRNFQKNEYIQVPAS